MTTFKWALLHGVVTLLKKISGYVVFIHATAITLRNLFHCSKTITRL